MAPSNKSSTKKKTAKKRKNTSSGLRLWRRRAVVAGVVVALVPFALVLLYTLPFIKPVSTLMVYQAVTGTDVKRSWVPIDDIAAPMQYAVVMSEDGQFCNHWGVDLGEI